MAEIAYDLHNTFRFHSDVFSVDLTGTYTASSIGIGDGRGGQLFSERVCVQSDTDAHVYCSRIITECYSLDRQRYIVDSQSTDEFRKSIDHLRRAMSSFDDSGARVAGIDLSSGGLRQIVQANVQIDTMAKAPAPPPPVLESPRQPALPPAPADPSADASDQHTKVCPDCGEKIRAAARKCRFCGYRFDQPDGSGTGRTA
jgi:ribosomal protein L40E